MAEFTLTDNPANTSTSLLRSLCHVDDSVILGSWLQETDHKAIEDQVSRPVLSFQGHLETFCDHHMFLILREVACFVSCTDTGFVGIEFLQL